MRARLIWILAVLVSSLALPAMAADCSACVTSNWPQRIITPGEPIYTVAVCNPFDLKGDIQDCQVKTVDQYTTKCEGSQLVSFQQGCKEYIQDPICDPWSRCGGVLVKMPMVPLLVPAAMGI